MTNLHSLTDAFDELERRADAASAAMTSDLPRARPRRTPRLVPVAAAVAVAAGLVTGTALLSRDGDPGTRAAAPPAGASATAPPASAPAPRPAVPSTPEELADRFRAVLGDTATFTVTETGAAMDVTAPPAPSSADGAADRERQDSEPVPTPNGAAIVGMLTASDVTGGFDLQILATTPGSAAWCDDPDRSRCTVRTLPDGSSLAVGRVPLHELPGGVTYQVNLIRPDGTEILMHVSNAASPKGASEILAPRPPLTTDQMVEIVTSDRW